MEVLSVCIQNNFYNKFFLIGGGGGVVASENNFRANRCTGTSCMYML